MLLTWFSSLFEPSRSTPDRLQISRFGIGFCPGCKRLRSSASLRCNDCGSTAPVPEDV
jgi:hypothetical protein